MYESRELVLVHVEFVGVPVEAEGDEGEEVDPAVAGAARGYPGNLIVKSNNDNTGLEETWTKRAIPWTF